MLNSILSSLPTFETTVIKLNQREVRLGPLISEGGYAYIYKAYDTSTNEEFALKKILLPEEQAQQLISGEIKIWKSLGLHKNIVSMVDFGSSSDDKSKYIYILMELCREGSLIDLLKKYNNVLSEKQIIYISKDIASGIKHLHSMKPPVFHRDLKVENVLLENKHFKICDFGSATSEALDPTKMSKEDQANQFEKYEKYTTLIYRPPELIEPLLKYKINEKMDIWMLGCIIYSLAYCKHPFWDCQKLAILNAYYRFPQQPQYSEKLQDLIRLLLTPNPNTRPSIFEVEQLLSQYDNLPNIPLNNEASAIKVKQNQYTNLKSNNVINQTKSKFDKDLSPDDILRLQENIMKNQNTKMKVKEMVMPKNNFEQKNEIRKEASKKEQTKLVDWVNFDCRNALSNDSQKPPSSNSLFDDF